MPGLDSLPAEIINIITDYAGPLATASLKFVSTCMRVSPRMSAGELMSLAAYEGNLNMVRWLYGIGCTADIFSGSFICAKAARGGHLHILKWLYAHGFPLAGCLEEAAFSGSVEIYKWFNDNHYRVKGGEDHHRIAAASGHLDLLKYLYENKNYWYSMLDAGDIAAAAGQLEVFEWYLERVGSTGHLQTVAIAVANNQENIVQRLTGCSIRSETGAPDLRCIQVYFRVNYGRHLDSYYVPDHRLKDSPKFILNKYPF